MTAPPTDADDEFTIPAIPASERALLGQSASSDEKVKQELKSLGSNLSEEDLAAQAKQSEHKRREFFLTVFEWLAVLTLVFLFAALFIIGVVWLLQIVLPERCRWLSADQTTILQDILTGGLVAGLIGEHFKKRLSG